MGYEDNMEAGLCVFDVVKWQKVLLVASKWIYIVKVV